MISGVTLAILGVPFALLLGVFVALVDLLPLVGGLLAGVPVVIIAAIHSVPAGIVMLVVFLVYQQIENHILNPVIMSKTVRLNPFWVLIAVLVGATLGGRVAGGLGTFVGALVGIPFGGAIQVIVRELRKGPDAVVEPAELHGPLAGAGAVRHLNRGRRRRERARRGRPRPGSGTGPAAAPTGAGAGAAAPPRMPAMRPLVVIPTYNESENIERMLHRIHECLPEAGVLVVDDGSPDGTAELVKAVAAELPDVHLLRPRRQVRAGERVPGRLRLGARARATTPSSRSTPTSRTTRPRCRRWWRRSSEGYDVSIGSRYVEGGSIPNWAWHRHLLSQGGNIYASTVLGLGVADSTAGFRAYSAGDPAPARPRPDPGRGLRLPDRDDVPRQAARRRHHRGADQLRRPGGRRVQDVVVHRGRGAGPGDLVGPGPRWSGACGAVGSGRRRAGPVDARRRQPATDAPARVGAGHTGAEDAGRGRHEQRAR